MPKLNLANEAVQNYFTEVGLYWIREFGIDGWRLDVADEMPTKFLEHFAATVKEKYPDALLLGETWGDAERLVSGNRLDCAMNYLFKDAVTDWIAKDKISVSTFDQRINRMLSLYPQETNLRMYNPLDSHDTARFLFSCGNDIARLRLGVALQMTLPGCPAIFYGDEIGITGDNDPLCRQAMQWDMHSHEIIPLYHFCFHLPQQNRRRPSLFPTLFSKSRESAHPCWPNFPGCCLTQKQYTIYYHSIFDDLVKINNRIIVDEPTLRRGLNGCCVPGKKRLYVTATGEYKACERIGSSPSIGNVDEGVDRELIVKKYVEEFAAQSKDICDKCWAYNLCRVCYAGVCNENGLDMGLKNEACRASRSVALNNLALYHELMEENPEALNCLKDAVIE